MKDLHSSAHTRTLDSVYLVTKTDNVPFHWYRFGPNFCAFTSLIMNSDAMQLVPNQQQQRTSTQQVANNSQSGNAIASLQPPVPQQGGPFPFLDAPKVAQPAGAHGSGSARGTKTSCASHLAPVLSIGLRQALGFCSLLSVAGGIAAVILLIIRPPCWRCCPSRSRSARGLCIRSNAATFNCSTSRWTCFLYGMN